MEYLCCWPCSKLSGTDWSKGRQIIPTTCRLVVVGQPRSGKTSLIFRFSRDRMPRSEEMRSSLDTDCMDVWRNGQSIRLSVQDTSGDEVYAKLRALAYNQADGVIICLPLDSPKSIRRLELDWAPEVRHLCKGKPYLLVGTKTDLRDNIGQSLPLSEAKFITEKQGKQIAEIIGAVAYLECSALDNCDGGQGGKRVFGRALRASLKRK